MNKKFHRVIFNAARGLRMVVGEVARGAGKGVGKGVDKSRGMRRAAVAFASACATLALLSAVAQAQIVADPAAPGARRATILGAANGVPLIHIQTPSAAGVSRNTYSQFDVGAGGAILNNSRVNTQTQLGGWVQANPWLAGGPARVILNEVNSVNPSRLQGWVEVAGARAEVIIANPAGIQANGGGFLNASGVTLTTGAPQWSAGGSISGYGVRSGVIAIEGAGLDAGGADYTQILARAARLSGGVWAKDLRVITGVNDVSAGAAAVTPHTAAQGPRPTLAIDVAQLGGMYAGKIYLLATEAGVGVNNAGVINAAGGALTLGAEGLLSNSGTLAAGAAAETLNLDIRGLANSGALASQGDLRLDDRGAASRNSGQINAARELIAQTSALDNQTGGLITAQGLRIDTQTLQNAGTIEQTGGPDAASRVTATQRIDNSGQMLSNGGIDLSAAQHLANTGTLTLRGLATPSLDNSGGTIRARNFSGGQEGFINQGGRFYAGAGLSLRTRQLDNRGGQLVSGGALDLGAERLNNGLNNGEGGLIVAGGAALVSAGVLDNQGGAIAAPSLEIQSATVLANQGGTLLADTRLSIESAGLNNTGGLIQTTEAASVLAIDAQGDAQGGAQSGTLDNRGGGHIGAAGDATLTAARILNQGGVIAGDAGLALASTAAGTGIDNSAGLIQTLGALSLEAGGGAIDNSAGGRLLANGDLTLGNRAQVRNDGGRIEAGQTLSIIDAGIAAGINAGIAAGDALAAATQDIVNTAGALYAGAALDIQSRSLSGDGSAQSGGGLTIALAADFSLAAAGEIAANGQLKLQSLAGIVNQGRIEGGGGARVEAANIDNQAGARITSAGQTWIEAGAALTNRGLIDGADTRIDAASVDNIGGGRIYGDRLSIAAVTLVNQAEGGVSATLAARERLDIGVQSLSNSGGGILSLGEMHIGGGLDPERKAAGQAQRIDNAGSLIQSGGHMSLAALETWNTNPGLAVGAGELVGTEALGDLIQVDGLEPEAASNFWETYDTEGLVRKVHPELYGIVYPRAIPNPRGIGFCGLVECTYAKADSPLWAEFGMTPPPGYDMDKAPPDPRDYGGQWVTDDLGVTVASFPSGSRPGVDKAGYEDALAAYEAERAIFLAAVTALDDAIAARNSYNQAITGAWRNYTYIRGISRAVYEDQVLASTPGRILAGGDVLIEGALNNLDATLIAGGAVQVSRGVLNNQATQGEHTEVTTGTADSIHWEHHGGGLGDGWQERQIKGSVAYAQTVTTHFDLPTVVFEEHQNLAAPEVQGNNPAAPHAGPGAAAAGQGSAPPAVTQYDGPTRNVRTLTSSPAPPTGSLYTLHPGNPNRPLVETDPAFAGYRAWLSSDYMLAQLAADPALTQKRLGDGFYEQQLLLQQIAQLTGQGRLGDYTDIQAQYQALMDAGVSVAREYGLRLGVALSAEQVARLTGDIVWLVSETLSLPDGREQTVLVPRLYVLTQPGDLLATGALIGGENILVQTGGDVYNSGAIAARNAVQINAQTIEDIGGRISARQAGLAAKRDIHIIGGTVQAARSLIASAGGDIKIESTTSTSSGAGAGYSYANTVIDRVASVSVTGGGGAPASTASTSSSTATATATLGAIAPIAFAVTPAVNGTLTLSAGNDLTLKAAGVLNLAEGGQTTLSAGNDIRLETLQTGSALDLAWDARNTLQLNQSAETGSAIAAAGALSLAAGRDIEVRASSIQTAGALKIDAAGDLQLSAGAAASAVDARRYRQTSGLFSSGTSSSLDQRGTSEVLSSTISGQSVELRAGGGLSAQAAQLHAQEAMTLEAGGELTLGAAQRSVQEHHEAHSTSSGTLFGKVFAATVLPGGITAMAYANNKQSASLEANGASTEAVGTSLSAGRLQTRSGGGTTLQAATIVADGDITMTAGGGLAIQSAQNTQTRQSTASASQSGMVGKWWAPAIGSVKSAEDHTGASTTQAASQIASLGGNIELQAGATYRQSASSVMALGQSGAGSGHIAISAQNVLIETAHDSAQSASQGKSASTIMGGSASVAGLISTDNLQDIGGFKGTLQAMDDTSDSRMQALGLANLAMSGKQIIDTVSALASGGGLSYKVSVNLSRNTSQYSSTASQRQAVGSSILAAGDLSITATGAGENSNIRVIGSTIAAGNNLYLQAGNAIVLEAGQSSYDQAGQNSSNGVSVGVGFGAGSQNGFSIDIGVSRARGSSDQTEVSYSNTRVSAGNMVKLQSGGDLGLRGAVIEGQSVQAGIGGNLHIESLQDTARGQSSQSSSGFNLSLCLPPICYGISTFAISLAEAGAQGDYAGVAEQSGIKAGDGGFQIDVKGDTTLKGAVIESTQAAIDQDKNSFKTGGALTLSDIDNHNRSSAESYAVSGSIGFMVGGAQSQQQAMRDRGMSKDQIATASDAKPGGSAGVGSAGDSQSSVTKSGISGIAGDQSVRTGDESSAGKLVKDWNTEALIKDAQAQAKIMGEFGGPAAKFWGEYANKKLAEALSGEDSEAAACWAADGACRTAGHMIIGALAGGAEGALGAAVSTQAAGIISKKAAEAGLSGAAHDAVVAALTALVGGAVGGATGAAGAFNEVTNNYLTSQQWEEFAAEMDQCRAKAGGCLEADAEALRAKYQAQSTAKNIALANCEETNNCAALKKEVERGTQTMIELLAQDGRLPIGGAANNDLGQWLGQRLANDPAYRATVNESIAVLNRCNANPSVCTQQAITAAALVLAPVLGPTSGVLINTLINAGKMTIAEAALLVELGGPANYCGVRPDLCLIVIETVLGTATGAAAPSALPAAGVRAAVSKAEEELALAVKAAQTGGGALDDVVVEARVAGSLDGAGGAAGGVAGEKAVVTSEGAANLATGPKLADDLAIAQAKDPRIGTTLPGANAPITVTAESNIGGRALFDTNQTARPSVLADPNKPTLISDLIPPGKPNSTMANAHAEVGLIQQAYDAGLTQGQNMTIVVRGEVVCTYCQQSTNLVAAADRAGLNSLEVVDTKAGITYVWTKGSNGLVEK